MHNVADSLSWATPKNLSRATFHSVQSFNQHDFRNRSPFLSYAFTQLSTHHNLYQYNYIFIYIHIFSTLRIYSFHHV
jgi:hypothetical protein